MAVTLRVTPDRLRTTAAQFNGTSNQVQNTSRQIVAIAGELRGTWGGQAASTYYGKIEGLQNDTRKIHRMINEHVQDLQKMANMYDTHENENVATNQSLRVDNIT